MSKIWFNIIANPFYHKLGHNFRIDHLTLPTLGLGLGLELGLGLSVTVRVRVRVRIRIRVRVTVRVMVRIRLGCKVYSKVIPKLVQFIS